MTLKGAVYRHIFRDGKEVTVTDRAVSHDETSDWDDETITESSSTEKALIDRPRFADRDRNIAERDVDVDFVMHFRDDTPREFNDGTENERAATLITFDGEEYAIVNAVDMGDGSIRAEVQRA